MLKTPLAKVKSKMNGLEAGIASLWNDVAALKNASGRLSKREVAAAKAKLSLRMRRLAH